VLKELSGF